jgi:hypothetical protein
MSLNSQARAVWAGATLKAWPGSLVLATFPRFAGDRVAAFAGRVSLREENGFACFVIEGATCSLTATESAFDSWRLKGRATAVTRGLRAVTIEASMPADLVGFFAPAAARLAAAKIPIIPQCGFHTDHVLVPQSRLDDALSLLNGLVADARKES